MLSAGRVEMRTDAPFDSLRSLFPYPWKIREARPAAPTKKHQRQDPKGGVYGKGAEKKKAVESRKEERGGAVDLSA